MMQHAEHYSNAYLCNPTWECLRLKGVFTKTCEQL